MPTLDTAYNTLGIHLHRNLVIEKVEGFLSSDSQASLFLSTCLSIIENPGKIHLKNGFQASRYHQQWHE